MYEFEYFSFFVILKLFTAGNVKKIEKHVFIVLIATVGGILLIGIHIILLHVDVTVALV